MNDILFETYLRSRRVTTDSRSITPGCIFFALKGEHFDGNAFVPQALEQGSAMCVTTDGRYSADSRCVVVDDVLAELQRLAAAYRRSLSIPVIGVTGTNGKTTTKELLHAVLSRRYRTTATAGNFNNHLGVPLTLLAIPADTEIAIVEMGANHPGEIEQLCAIADPSFGLITNVGRAHLEGFGSFEGVVRTKTELYRHLAAKHGTIFVNADNERLMQEAAPIAEKRTYGSVAGADVRGTYVDSDPYMHFYFEQGDNVYNVRSRMLGAYNFDNAMAAVAVGLHFGVEPFDIKLAIEEYQPANQRSQWKTTARNSLYLDCYNANPSSMAAAVDSFSRLPGGHKVAVIGGMRELGAASRQEHEALVARLEQCRLEQVLLVGGEFSGIALPAGFVLFPDTLALAEHLKAHPLEGCTVLVKGSNGNRLWELESIL